MHCASESADDVDAICESGSEPHAEKIAIVAAMIEILLMTALP
jgi:hypothetical protein